VNAVTRFPAQVAKLIPRLASDQDGEVVAAARALDRTLKGAGLDLHALAAVVEKPPEVREVVVYRERSAEPQPWPSWRYSRQETTWSEIARWCRDNDRGRLSPKERGFVNDMAARLVMNGQPTERQAEWLRGIHAKLNRSENAA
jgi:hypothetical protein